MGPVTGPFSLGASNPHGDAVPPIPRRQWTLAIAETMCSNTIPMDGTWIPNGWGQMDGRWKLGGP